MTCTYAYLLSTDLVLASVDVKKSLLLVILAGEESSLLLQQWHILSLSLTHFMRMIAPDLVRYGTHPSLNLAAKRIMGSVEEGRGARI